MLLHHVELQLQSTTHLPHYIDLNMVTAKPAKLVLHDELFNQYHNHESTLQKVNSEQLNFVAPRHTYGRKSTDRTKHGNDLIFFFFLATVFDNLEV